MSCLFCPLVEFLQQFLNTLQNNKIACKPDARYCGGNDLATVPNTSP